VAGAVAVVLTVAAVTGLLLIRQRGTAPTPVAAGHSAGSLTMTAQLDFRCTLPVQAYGTQARISVPEGSVTVDHTLQPSKATPSYGATFAAGRWLPVPPAWVSPDGRSYAYITTTTGVPGQPPTTALHVHDVAASADRPVWSSDGYAQLIGWAAPAELVFARQAGSAGLASPLNLEVWALDPADPGRAHRIGPNPTGQPASSGAIVPLFQGGSRIVGGAVWTVSAGSRQQGPAAGAQPAIPHLLVRMDLKDGSLRTWFTSSDAAGITVIAIDQQGHPIVVVTTLPTRKGGPPQQRVLLLTGPDQSVEIASGADPSFRPVSAIADGHGIWLTSLGSLWLYRQGALTKIADVPASLFQPPAPPANAPTPPTNVATLTPSTGVAVGTPVMLAGPCR
jgi:hypothetical protein